METKKTKIGNAQTPTGVVQNNGGKMNTSMDTIRMKSELIRLTDAKGRRLHKVDCENGYHDFCLFRSENGNAMTCMNCGKVFLEAE